MLFGMFLHVMRMLPHDLMILRLEALEKSDFQFSGAQPWTQYTECFLEAGQLWNFFWKLPKWPLIVIPKTCWKKLLLFARSWAICVCCIKVLLHLRNRGTTTRRDFSEGGVLAGNSSTEWIPTWRLENVAVRNVGCMPRQQNLLYWNPKLKNERCFLWVEDLVSTKVFSVQTTWFLTLTLVGTFNSKAIRTLSTVLASNPQLFAKLRISLS